MVDKQLVAWLNSSHNYLHGVALYTRLGKDEELKAYFAKTHESKTSKLRLYDSMRHLYYFLKNKTPIPPSFLVEEKKSVAPSAPHALVVKVEEKPKDEPTFTPNVELEAACKKETDKYYKQLMNTRAKLFMLCNHEASKEENNKDIVGLRELLVMEMLELQPSVNDGYAVLEYVKRTGKLPDAPQEHEPLPSSALELYKKRLNLTKNINKLKKKEQTPARIALLQSHQELIIQIDDAISKL